ncbi:hypothetical protein V1478_006149 [Vespula squamosa]|uniref:Uncharacterized protein n=1 Tax=Vespula squamosa TaxID=30214 RepID=A0ABD2B708_VESSQ
MLKKEKSNEVEQSLRKIRSLFPEGPKENFLLFLHGIIRNIASTPTLLCHSSKEDYGKEETISSECVASP